MEEEIEQEKLDAAELANQDIQVNEEEGYEPEDFDFLEAIGDEGLKALRQLLQAADDLQAAEDV